MDQNVLDRYNTTKVAEDYKNEYQRKLHRKISDRLERRIFKNYFEIIGRIDSLLDIPCGAGRLFPLFREYSKNIIEADFSMPMLILSRRDNNYMANLYLRCNALNIPFLDYSIDCVVSIRLNHHIEVVEERKKHLEECFRVAKKAVIVTWFSHYSFRALSRRIRARLGFKKREKYTLKTSEVKKLAEVNGFKMVKAKPLTPLQLGSSHIFGLFLREDKSSEKK